MSSSLPALRTICLAISLGVAALTWAGPKPANVLEKIFYDLGVIGYCGIGNDQVKAGFQRELDRLIARDGSTEKEVQAAYNRALDLVYREWDNRGLGGFRGWCRSEGRQAVERFLAVPD